MIKRAMILSVLSVICAAAVFGAGFALWSFDTQFAEERDMGVRVTQSAALGFFSAPTISRAVLDGGTGSGINPTITGISFYKSENGETVTDSSFTVRFTVADKLKAEIDADGNWDKVRFGMRMEVPTELDGLIEHTPFYTERVGADGYIDLKALAIELTDRFDDSDHVKSDFVYADGVFEFALETTTLNRFFTYVPSQKPTTLEKYEKIDLNFAPCFVLELWQGYGEA